MLQYVTYSTSSFVQRLHKTFRLVFVQHRFKIKNARGVLCSFSSFSEEMNNTKSSLVRFTDLAASNDKLWWQWSTIYYKWQFIQCAWCHCLNNHVIRISYLSLVRSLSVIRMSTDAENIMLNWHIYASTILLHKALLYSIAVKPKKPSQGKLHKKAKW